MASEPEELIVSAYSKNVSPGYLYNLSTKEYSPGDTKHAINIEQCKPEYEIVIKSKKEISRIVEKSEVMKDTPWAQDLTNTNYSDYILLQGRKICEYKGNVKPHMKLHVVSSIYCKSYIDVLICFDQEIEEEDIVDLKNYIESLKGMKISKDIQNRSEGTDFYKNQPDTTIAYLPQKIDLTFSVGYIYEKGNKTVASSVKYGLEEFCHYLVHSDTDKFPVNCKVKRPLNTSSYASVVKNEPRIFVSDKVRAAHSELDQSYCIGVPDNAAHVVKPSQGVELPVTHNTQSKTKPRGSDSTTFGHHCPVTVENSEQKKSIPDKKHTHFLRTDRNLSEKTVYRNVEQQVINHQVSDRKKAFSGKQIDKKAEQLVILHQVKEGKSCLYNNSETHSNFEVPQDDAYSQYSRKNIIPQSSQNPTTPECVHLDTCTSKNIKSYKSKSYDSTVHDNAQEMQYQEKTNLPNLTNVGNMNISEKHESLERNQLKFEHKADHVMSEKSLSGKSNPPEFNSSNAESSTLFVPVKETEVCGITRKFYGVIPEAEGKTIILLGASGSGKTTLVNFIANYFIGSRKATGKLIQVARNSNDIQGHTTQITGYTFCESKNDHPFTIIDTPGLNDSSGAEVQDHVQSLKTFLANADSQNLKIHAIGFVAQAHIVRLTSSERLVMDYISSLFGKEIEKHVISFVTFSDNQETPPVVEAINRYGVNCSVFLKFNNSALSNSKEEEIDELDRIYWRIGCKSWKKCIKLLENLLPLSFKSLTDEIYVTQIMEVAERDLLTEIKDFMNYCRKNKVINKEVLNNTERVWNFAETVEELRFMKTSQYSSVNNILLNYVEEICASQNSYLSTKECMKLLYLSPSRPLLKAGLAIISSAAPIYNSVKQKWNQSPKWEQKHDPPEMLFCHVCNYYHVFTRIETRSWMNKVTTNYNIGYKCTECKCPGDVHGENGKEDEKYEHPESYGFTPLSLLHHTRNNIEKVLGDLCLPEYKIQENEYIKWLECFVKQEAQQFCKDLLSIQ